MSSSIIMLVPLLAIVLWIVAALKMSKKKDGGISFLKHFVTMLVLLGVLYLVIIVPILNCRGMLCGLENVLAFLGISTLMNFVWPTVLIVKNPSTTATSPPQKKKVVATDILDDDFDLLDDLIK
ncbi:MAG: hypothetical protein GY810_26270 [Aureispira sp.]|nr:hypothetical protein [Aureispira sp.]